MFNYIILKRRLSSDKTREYHIAGVSFFFFFLFFFHLNSYILKFLLEMIRFDSSPYALNFPAV